MRPRPRLIGLALCAALVAGERRAAALDTVTPDAAMQQAIARVATATSEAALNGPLILLKAKGGDDFSLLVPQLLYFSMRATDVRAGMAPAVIVDRLHITPQQQLRAVVPYLATPDAALQRELRNLFDQLDGGSAAEPPDFTAFAAVLRGGGAEPTVLIAYMLDTAPELGLALLADTYVTDAEARRALLTGTRSSADLERLARHETWWVRLYVVERMQQDPSLRNPAVLQRLRDDPHPTVRAAAGAP
ncbi:MAG: hypothetical protein SF182_28875 [Deltaproteobacteria bacterium]|nr:hypothetical protein [Deltaproteobacteria bacterium]